MAWFITWFHGNVKNGPYLCLHTFLCVIYIILNPLNNSVWQILLLLYSSEEDAKAGRTLSLSVNRGRAAVETLSSEVTAHTLDGVRSCCLVQSLSHVPLFVTPWTAAGQASLCFTISWSLLRLMSIESVMPSNHFIPFPKTPSPALSLSQHQCFLQWDGSLHHMAKVLELQLQHQSFQWVFRVYLL